MMTTEDLPHWKRLSRSSLLDTKFMKVYQDTIELPSGQVIDDYTVATLPSGVIIVATDKDNRLITQFEYKYAIDKVILNLPSGSMDKSEDPIEAGKKELLEETGYEADEWELVATTYEYPSKLDHLIYVVRAKQARKVNEVTHEETETISDVLLMTADRENISGEFNTTYSITALALTLPEFLKR